MGWLGGKLLISTMRVTWRWTLSVQVHLQQNGDVEANLHEGKARNVVNKL